MAMDNLPGTKLFTQRDVRETPIATISLAAQLAPIGSVMAWLKSYPNTPSLPAGWVECEGQVLSDADSIYNGQTIPDLDGGEFLRGWITSSGTGGSDTMAHTHTGTASGTTGTGTAHNHSVNKSSYSDIQNGGSTTVMYNAITGNESSHTHSFSDDLTTSAASNTENRPPYYNVVWIMRIK